MSSSEFLDIYKESHLTSNDVELALTQLEFGLIHITEAFRRWTATILRQVGGDDLSFFDGLVLHTVRFRERPKGVAEIARFLNREDVSNVQYSLRKLESAGLLAKVPGKARRETTYQVTAAGVALTDHYARLRRDVLVRMVQSLGEHGPLLDRLTDALNVVAGLYEQGALRANLYHGELASDGAAAPDVAAAPSAAVR